MVHIITAVSLKSTAEYARSGLISILGSCPLFLKRKVRPHFAAKTDKFMHEQNAQRAHGGKIILWWCRLQLSKGQSHLTLQSWIQVPFLRFRKELSYHLRVTDLL